MPGESTAGAAGDGVAAGELGADAVPGDDVAAALAGALGEDDTLAPAGALTGALTEGGRGR